MPRVFILAYGNPLRSDDGLAWRAADVLAAKYSVDKVEVVALHQLGPELAESVSRSECVIFVDAAAGSGRPGDIRITEIYATSASSAAPGFCHAVSPSHVLALAAQLYNVRPRAYSATLVGKNFDHGESLSAPVKAAIPELVVRIDELVQKFINNKGQDVARRKT